MKHQLVKKYNRQAKNPLMLCHVEPLLFIEKTLYEIAAACKQAAVNHLWYIVHTYARMASLTHKTTLDCPLLSSKVCM
jgi:hypothetical protein